MCLLKFFVFEYVKREKEKNWGILRKLREREREKEGIFNFKRKKEDRRERDIEREVVVFKIIDFLIYFFGSLG